MKSAIAVLFAVCFLGIVFSDADADALFKDCCRNAGFAKEELCSFEARANEDIKDAVSSLKPEDLAVFHKCYFNNKDQSQCCLAGGHLPACAEACDVTKPFVISPELDKCQYEVTRKCGKAAYV
uniref:Uncharacterized protein n=1 Tax=Panagrolaimus sp. JU765 TaxID=591449 RepID=A0AC34QGU0_9BILA